jgi:mRNA interferase YafQ
MKEILYTKSFRKDMKRLQKAGENFTELRQIIIQLANSMSLVPKYRDHRLLGTYQGCRECHIKPDWLLIYESTETELVLVRTGSHAELFK